MSEELIDYDKELESGKYLFKYCKFDVNALQIIINKTLYFSSPEKLNDPLDSKFDLKIINSSNFSNETRDYIKYSGFPLSEEVRILLKDAGSIIGNYDSQRKLLEAYFAYMQNAYSGICCFSTKLRDKNLLWSHYANEGRGLCFVFDKEKLNHSLENLEYGYRILPSRKVEYDGVKTLEVEINEKGELLYTFEHLFSKTKHWSVEEEYRIILEKHETKLFDLEPNRFLPFLKFDDDCLKFIIFGQRIPTEHLAILDNLEKGKVFKAELLKHKFDR